MNSSFHVECLNGICCFSKLLAHFFLDCGLSTPAGAKLQEREANWTENQEIEAPQLALSLLTVPATTVVAIIKIL